MDTELRIMERKDSDGWTRLRLKELKPDDIVRVFEADGTYVGNYEIVETPTILDGQLGVKANPIS